MKRLILKSVSNILLLLSDTQFRKLWIALARYRCRSLKPAEAMRFLLETDSDLYLLEGDEAVRYGSGEHPKHRLMRYHDFFIARIKPGERVLDIGCGIGALARDVAEHSKATVVGIDLDEQNISVARSRYAHKRVEYRVGNVLTDLPYEKFDVAILSNVLEHLPDRANFLRKLVQVARPSRLLVRVPLFDREWRVPLKKELGVDYRLDNTHETEYTTESFAQEIAAAGLRIVHQEIRWGEIWAEVMPL